MPLKLFFRVMGYYYRVSVCAIIFIKPGFRFLFRIFPFPISPVPKKKKTPVGCKKHPHPKHPSPETHEPSHAINHASYSITLLNSSTVITPFRHVPIKSSTQTDSCAHGRRKSSPSPSPSFKSSRSSSRSGRVSICWALNWCQQLCIL